MARAIAALTLTLATVVFASDTWVCVDGCTDEAPLASSSPSGCMLCQRGLDVEPIRAIGCPSNLPIENRLPYLEPALPLVEHPIDHPPRNA